MMLPFVPCQFALAISVLFVTAFTALGQAKPIASRAMRSDSTKVYVYVEQMPRLPGGGSVAVIAAAIRERMPSVSGCGGKVFVSFVVGPSGVVKDAKVVKGSGASCDAVILAGVNKLPRFQPGKQSGQAVSVSFTVPVTF